MPKSPITTHLSSAFAGALDGVPRLPAAEGQEVFNKESQLRAQQARNNTAMRGYAQEGHPPRGYKFDKTKEK